MAKRSRLIILIAALMTPIAYPQEVQGKCGTYRYVQMLNQEKKSAVDIASAEREIRTVNELTRSGKFRVHFDTAGIHEPAMLDVSGNRIPNSFRKYVDTLKFFLDSVWRAEIDEYGFIPPPSDDMRGGGPEYDVYVTQFGGGAFGETVIEQEFPVGPVKPNRQYTTYMRIENDFVGYRTSHDSAVAVTCAHEFHHAIQVGGSGLWNDQDFYFYEMSAQSMEPTVFPHVKDYFLDLKPYYTQISTWSLFRLNPQGVYLGYERAIWGHFLIKRYGPGVMKKIWEEMKTKRPVSASQSALNSFSTSLEREFVEFSIWNLYTGKIADSIRYFPDAKLFPSVGINGSTTLNGNDHLFEESAIPFTMHYFTVKDGSDSVFISVTNTNFTDINNDDFPPYPFQLLVSSNPFSGAADISGKVYAKLFVSDISNWNFSVPGIVRDIPYAYPNPFNPYSSLLRIPLSGLASGEMVDLYIFSISYDLVVNLSVKPNFDPISGTFCAQWNGKDDKGKIVSSGIYHYVLSKGSQTIKGKFAVIR